MDRQRTGNPTRASGYHSQLLHAMGQFLPRRGLPLLSDDARVRWTDRLVVINAILMTWMAAPTLRDAFEMAREVVVSMYRSRRRPGKTLSGFLQILGDKSLVLLERVVHGLRQSVRQVAGSLWRMDRWVLMAVDGSRTECPRTRANERAFGCAGRHKTGPQQFITTVFHLATGLIWDWRRGSGKEAERNHLRKMIASLPCGTLLLADAGFTGYDLLRSLRAAGHDFIVRVGKNVRLLRELGYAVQEHRQTVYLWPKAYHHQEPLVLRLVELGKGKRRVCLLTSVRSPTALPDKSVARLYRQRWLVEVQFRSLKQTMAHRKMLSTTPNRAGMELDWAMAGLWMLGLLAAGKARRGQQGQWSAAGSLRVVRRAMRRPKARPPAGGLASELQRACRDRYRRRGPKQARDWPRKKKESPPGCPRIRMASIAEVTEARELPPWTVPRKVTA